MRHVPKLVTVILLLAMRTPARAHSGAPPIEVMTYNLYLGADIEDLLSSATPQDFVTAVEAALQSVVASNFPARAAALAREIAGARPDLIGLEEVAHWQVSAGCPSSFDLDFLDVLEAALTAAGARYSVAAITDETDLSANLSPGCGVHFLDRDVILVRDDARLTLSNVQEEHYHNLFSAPTPLGTLTITRGFASVDVERGTTRFRFIDTHLESVSDVYRDAQAAELLVGPTLTLLPVVVVGDFNFTPRSSPWRTFRLFGFLDVWHQLHPSFDEPTCCQAPDLLNATSELSERIDLVWTRGLFQPLAAEVVGADPADRTSTTPPLWPSDHAGVVVALRPPRLPLVSAK